MAAQTSDQVREFWSIPESAPSALTTILANKILFENALSMSVSGKAQPYVSGTANSKLLGFSRNHYESPAGSDLVLDESTPAVFRRGVAACPGKAGDLPTQALIDVAGGVAFDDSSGTVKATPASNDLTGTLRRIEGAVYWVEV